MKFGAKLGLRSKIHQTYVTGQAGGQVHAYLNKAGLHMKDGSRRDYKGRENVIVISWLGTAEAYKRDREKEKKFVDEICGANANIIDLEMGLPALANAEKKVAPRMDLVALEPAGAGWRIVFWEAKLAGNPELKQMPNERKKGNIFDHVETYATWLAHGDNTRLVASAFQHTCKILVALHQIANRSGLQVAALGDGIRAVAAGARSPEVDPKPRVIVDHRDAKTGSLTGPLDRLREAEIQAQVVYDSSGFVLETRA